MRNRNLIAIAATVLSCGGANSSTARDLGRLTAAEAITIACPRIYDRIVEDESASYEERVARLHAARGACEMILEEIARSSTGDQTP